MQIVRIGDGQTQRASPETVGGKAANLARMAALGLPVPPAFVLPIELCAAIVAADPDAERHLADGLREGIAFLESVSAKQFGDRRRPLLVSVRSGAAQSMPGMLDTVLDVGCTAAAVRGLVRMTGNPRFAWDCRQRFLESYAAIVAGVDPTPFTARLPEMLVQEGVNSARELDGEALERLAAAYHVLLADDGPPDDPMVQLTSAARAVYRSGVFLPNYDMEIAKLMVAGSDLWLNTPLPPLEASGTSGMKAALNGVLNLSILDGWWIEACISKRRSA